MINKISLIRYGIFISRLIRFALVGFSGVIVDLGGFYFLHSLLGLNLTPSSMLSTELAIINNFFWNDMWTFGDVVQKENLVLDNSHRLQRFFKFNLICFLGLILNSLIVNFLVYKFAINPYLAKLIAIICVISWNFGMNMRFNWQVMKKKES
jgi:dolichol-phosphate mannosyltransferase